MLVPNCTRIASNKAISITYFNYLNCHSILKQYVSRRRLSFSNDILRKSSTTTNANSGNEPFPWRARAITPLARLNERDDLSNIPNNFRARVAKRMTSAYELNHTFWEMLTASWEREIADNCSWAFRMALCGLISRVFHIPIWKIDNTEDGIRIDTRSISKVNDGMSDLNEDVKGDDADDSGEEVLSEYIEKMVEGNLLALYQPTSSNLNGISGNNSIYEILFSLKPTAARLENIFLIPSLTRQDVNKDESLRGAYTAIETRWFKSGNVEDLRRMADELRNKTDHLGAKRSVIIDVSVDCKELFQIKNKLTGELIQGTEVSTEEETTHLIRFEMVTCKGENKSERELGSWYIIDIDDQLNGNVWH